MKPFFIFSPPRHRGDLLVRIMNGIPGVRCAGDAHDFLGRLRRLHRYRAALFRDHPRDFPAEGGDVAFQRFLHHSTKAEWDESIRSMLPIVCEPQAGDVAYGMRDIFSLTGKWEEDALFLSWLQFLEPEAKFIFLKRADEDLEVSIEYTYPAWIPRYEKCTGGVMKRIRGVWKTAARYHRLNPESTLLLDSADLLDADLLEGKLVLLGVPFCRESWQREIVRKPGNRRVEAASLPQKVRKYTGPLRLTPPPAKLGHRMVVHTLRFGEASWIQDCVPSQSDWCSRHGIGLHVWSEWNPEYPDAKFVIIDMLRHFVASGEEWMLYIDADIFIHPLAPPPTFDSPGLHILRDGPGPWVQDFPRWVIDHFDGPEPLDWIYRNTGVWACDRAAAQALLDVIEPPFIKKIHEQNQLNFWIWKANLAGMPVHDLNYIWNCFGRPGWAAWFYHLAGKEKDGKLAALRTFKLIPSKPETFEILPPPEIERAIVFPWKANKAVWQELRYSLRSIDKFFADRECPIILLADRKPEWLREDHRVVFWQTERYQDALTRGLQFAKEVIWWNDDIYALKECGWDTFDSAIHFRNNLLNWARSEVPCKNAWRKGLRRVTFDLNHHGLDNVLNFSTHTPYRYEYGKAMELLRRFGAFWKIPFETVYYNWHRDHPRRIMRRERTDLFLNHGASGPSDEEKGKITALFPEPAPWEF